MNLMLSCYDHAIKINKNHLKTIPETNLVSIEKVKNNIRQLRINKLNFQNYGFTKN